MANNERANEEKENEKPRDGEGVKEKRREKKTNTQQETQMAIKWNRHFQKWISFHMFDAFKIARFRTKGGNIIQIMI